MDDEEEKVFLHLLTQRIWKARREGTIVDALHRVYR